MALTETNRVITKLTLLDLAACWALDQRCFPVLETYDRDILRYLLANPYSISYKLTVDTIDTVDTVDTHDDSAQPLIGFVLGQVARSGVGHVVRLAVDPAYRRHGCGRQLLQAIEAGFQAAGISLIHLEVRATNKNALHLYVQLDYIIVERLHHYYNDGEDGLMMVKALDIASTGTSNAELPT
jgi:ribosomal protein S18 acetylase RimI-like enzyme